MRRVGPATTVGLVQRNPWAGRTRSRLMPINERYPLDELLAACRDFPMPKRKNIHYIDTYTLLKSNPQYHAEDGIHVIREFYPLWMDTLVNNSGLKNLL